MTDTTAVPQIPKKKCFVVMGFGEKADLATGRTLDLDKTYRLIIKKAVEEAGLECIRADDIIHSSIIDVPMYEWLYAADLVVADLSTTNANAIYELGVRHALKPKTTIIMAESQFKYPFDLGHIAIEKYEHLGKGIDGEEAERAKEVLKNAIIELVGNDSNTDSPVYTFMPTLTAPSILSSNKTEIKPEIKALPEDEQSFSMLLKMFKEAKADSDWVLVTGFLKKLLKIRPNDDYLTQQLALATYKSKEPSVEEALEQAKNILSKLNPLQTTDPETLGLWGAIAKRFWDIKATKADLNEAIWAYEKGFYLKNDFYNGINFAFLLNVRASVSDKRDAIADTVIAERIRKRVVDICNGLLYPGAGDGTKTTLPDDPEQKFWLQASLVEAYLGSGQKEEADKLKENISKGTAEWMPASWMVDTMNSQLDKLTKLLAEAPAL
jgi:hypothetical protein